MTSHEQPTPKGNSEKRVESELKVYYGPSRQVMLSGFSVDVSQGGLYLKTDFPLLVGETLTLIFSLPDQNKSISCKAKITWVNDPDNPLKPEFPPGVGVRFDNLPAEAFMTISRFVETR